MLYNYKTHSFEEGFSDLTQNSNATKIYMVSGGDGYIDFRLGIYISIYEKCTI
jgi:hypothetical protein